LTSETTGVLSSRFWGGTNIKQSGSTQIFLLRMRKLHSMEMSLSGMSLLDVFLRDDAIYFAAMTLANLAIIFTFYARTQGLSLNTC